MSSSEITLLQLSKVAVGNSQSCDFSSNDVNWSEVMDAAYSQGLLGITFDAIELLPSAQNPDLDSLMEWFGEVRYMEEDYIKYVDTIRQIAGFFGRFGLKVLLMKGYGCAINFPKPDHRPCGDIDIYVMDENGEHNEDVVKYANQMLTSQLSIEITYENGHHSQFQFGGFTIENHSTILDVDVHKSNVFVNRLLEEEAKNCIKNIDSTTGACLPTVRFNSIHLLRHMASDFATVKTTFRNVLDWSTFVSKNKIDWDFVREVVHRANMSKFLSAVNGICVHTLGYPSEKFPIEEKDETLETRVLDDILNCSDDVDRPKDRMSFLQMISYGRHKTTRLWQNRWKHHIVFDELLFSTFWWKAKNWWKR